MLCETGKYVYSHFLCVIVSLAKSLIRCHFTGNRKMSPPEHVYSHCHPTRFLVKVIIVYTTVANEFIEFDSLYKLY